MARDKRNGNGGTESALARSSWRWLRWVPPALMGLLVVVCWALVLRGELAGVVAWLLLISAVPLLGALVLLVSAIRALWKRALGLPSALTLTLALAALYPGLWAFGVAQIAYPASIESAEPASSVRLPSNQPLRVAWGGDGIETNYHSFYPEQRWAYDLLIEPYFVQSTQLTDYGCYGTEVVAPASGVVRVAHDGDPDLPPGKPTNPPNPTGNHVALELPTGTFLVLAHMQQGSVRVRVGEAVREGEVLGSCGNSGNTSEPHIHIHHQRQNPAVSGPGIAEGLPLFFRDHDGPPMPTGGIEIEDGKPVARGVVVRHLGPATAN